jgi:hypothetical protein
MPSLIRCTRGALVAIAVLLPAACATRDYVSDMYQPNFGLHKFSHFDASSDPDPTAVANGLYAPRPLQRSCYLCSPSQAPFDQAGWAP